MLNLNENPLLINLQEVKVGVSSESRLFVALAVELVRFALAP